MSLRINKKRKRDLRKHKRNVREKRMPKFSSREPLTVKILPPLIKAPLQDKPDYSSFKTRKE